MDRRQKHSPAQSRPPTQQTLEAKRGEPGRLTGKKLWLARAGMLFLAPVCFLLLAEGILRLADFGYPVSFFVRSGEPGTLVTNDRFAWQFFSKRTVLQPFLFKLPVKKAPGAIRICVLGESAAMGTPDPAFSFSRILEAMLHR